MTKNSDIDLQAEIITSGHGRRTVTVLAPNGTRVRVSVDEITGGLRVTQLQDEAGRGMLSAVPLGLGVLLLDDRA